MQHGLDYRKKQEAVMSMGRKESSPLHQFVWVQWIFDVDVAEWICAGANRSQAFHIIAKFCLCMWCLWCVLPQAANVHVHVWTQSHHTWHKPEKLAVQKYAFLILFYQYVFENRIPTTTVCNVMSIEYFYQIKTFLSDPTTCMEFPKNYRMTVVFLIRATLHE